MSTPDEAMRASRRRFLASAAAGASLGGITRTVAAEGRTVTLPTVRFWGAHQGGIVTLPQSNTYFAAFDLLAGTRGDVAMLLRCWTDAAVRMTAGQTAQPLDSGLHPVAVRMLAAQPPGYDSDPGADPATLAADTGEVDGLAPARLTLTFGFGAGVFEKDGEDRYGLRARRPEAFVDLPGFVGDQLAPERTGGDVSVQACADDPQVAFHAIRQLARLGEDVVRLRWAQSGFLPRTDNGDTPRNLMGFKDGTNNPPTHVLAAMHRFVWVGGEGPDWMQGGSYLVARRIHIALQRWDRMSPALQERMVGRQKLSGAPLGRQHEFDPIDLGATDHGGNPLVPENSHVRLAHPENNGHAQILRRPYSYNDGLSRIDEPSARGRQRVEYDAGLFFICYQRDPRSGFIRIYERMAQRDMMNQFATHVGGGMFACPRGVAEGEYIGQHLFEGA